MAALRGINVKQKAKFPRFMIDCGTRHAAWDCSPARDRFYGRVSHDRPFVDSFNDGPQCEWSSRPLGLQSLLKGYVCYPRFSFHCCRRHCSDKSTHTNYAISRQKIAFEVDPRNH